MTLPTRHRQMQRPQRIEIFPTSLAFEGLRSKMAANLDFCILAWYLLDVLPESSGWWGCRECRPRC